MEGRPVVERYLRWTRRLRFAFALLAVLAGGSVVVDSIPWANELSVGVVGYLVGAILAELAIRTPGGPAPSALLSLRILTTYVPT